MKSLKIEFALITLAICFLLCSSARAATLTCNGSQSDCQSKVNSAVDGDTVSIPAGAFNWGGTGISWTDKNISIVGAGIDVTVITVTNWAFTVNDNTKASFRISGMTIGGPTTTGYIKITSFSQSVAQWVYGWRVDHIKFNPGTSLPPYSSMYIVGVNWGVIDHCDFQALQNSSAEFFHIEIVGGLDTSIELNHGTGAPLRGGYSWSLPMNWGTQYALYIEDNNFNAPYLGGAGHPIDAWYGARVVFRYNTAVGGGPLFHPVENSNFGTIKYEVYNNSFSGAAYTGWYPFFVQGGGTGVVFNNQWINFGTGPGQLLGLRELRAQEGQGCTNGYSTTHLLYCNGSRSWDGNIEGNGWPCFGQVGRSPGPLGAGVGGTPVYGVSDPVYAWRNGVQAGCYTGGSCTNTVLLSSDCATDHVKSTAHSNGNVDFVNNGTTPKPGYTPYIYPHPLTLTEGGPSPPGNVRITN